MLRQAVVIVAVAVPLSALALGAATFYKMLQEED